MAKVTILDLQKMKDEGKKITMLTAYDYSIAAIIDKAGIDIILVGDSVGNVMLGYENTLPVTMDEMVHHTKSVCHGRENALLVADMPFMSYQISIAQAKENAGRLIKEGGAEAVKVEGGANIEEVIKAIVDIDVPVMAHIGLTPQSIHKMGGYKVQGKEEKQREKLLSDAVSVERAGAFAVVLEVIPEKLAYEITKTLTIPTIGIGAGRNCDGQVLVIHDLLGLSKEFRPKFVKKYVDLHDIINQSVDDYIREVREGIFPSDEHTFH